MTFPPTQHTPPNGRFRPPNPPYPTDPTTATRHLCAGAYLDDDFRNQSLRKVFYQPRRLVAPSFGFELIPVLGHCLRARNATLIRDGAICFALLVSLCLSFTAVFLAGGILVTIQVLVSTWRYVRDIVAWIKGGEPIPLGLLWARATFLSVGWWSAFFLLTVAFGQTLSDWLAAAANDRNGQLPTTPPPSVQIVSNAALGFAVVALVIPLFAALWRQYELDRLTPGKQPGWPSASRRMTDIHQQQHGNTVIYGNFRPFVGSGEIVDTKGFAVRLVRPAPSLDPRNLVAARPFAEAQLEFAEAPFDAQELVDHVKQHLSQLVPTPQPGPQKEAEEQIPNLTVTDRVFLAGTEASNLSPNIAPDVMAGVVRHPTTPARHYVASQVVAWGGEIVVTVHLHLAVQGRSLYVELTTTALGPCDERYRIVSLVEGTGPVAWLKAAWGGIAQAPGIVVRAPYNLVRSAVDVLASTGYVAASTVLQRGYDYGAQVSVRELGSSDHLRNFSQRQDLLKYRRLIERRVFAAILDFLDAKGVDTTEYRQRAGNVLNVGIGNFGTGQITFAGQTTGQQLGPTPEPAV